MGSSTTVSLEAANAKKGRPVLGQLPIVAISIVASAMVFAISLAIQWIVYDDVLHRSGPLRFVGTTLAALLTFTVILNWQLGKRRKDQELLRRFQTISEMNDRIRNALQVIECTVYVSQPKATTPIRQAVDAIDAALRQACFDVAAFPSNDNPKPVAAEMKKGKSA
jgi:branched-subunit amino acid ABC-type transport system permease component